jgi:hypothetical protein
MIHAGILEASFKRAGFIIPGVCDPSGGGSSTADGKNTRDLYRKEYGIRMHGAINSIEPGINTVLDALVTDKLKIFNTCIQAKREFQLYRRNEKGRPVGDDHLMDNLRYLMMSGVKIAKSLSQVQAEKLLAEREYESFKPRAWEAYGF